MLGRDVKKREATRRNHERTDTKKGNWYRAEAPQFRNSLWWMPDVPDDSIRGSDEPGSLRAFLNGLGMLEYVNPAFTSLFGYGKADLPDRATWFERAFPDATERGHMELLYREYTASSPEASLGRPRITTIRTRDGRNLPCELRILSLPTGEHLVVYNSIAGD